MSVLATKQVGDSVLIQVIGPHTVDRANLSGPSIREGSIPIAEFGAFWDSLEHLGFWRLNNAYRALATSPDDAGGSITVSYETRNHRMTTKTVRFFAPESCSLAFRQVYSLFENMARFAKSVPSWRDLLRYETDEPIEGLKDWYHAEALQAIAVARDSQGLDTLLSMLVHNDEYATAVVWGLGNIDSSLAVATLENLLARLEAEPPSADRDSLALHASKILVQLNGRQSVPAIRHYLSAPHDRSLVSDWCVLLAGVGDYSVVPEVVEMLSDSSNYRRDYVRKAAGTLQGVGYRSRTVISALFQAAERELKERYPDDETVVVLLRALTALTGEEFKYNSTCSMEVKRASLAEWLRWWEANASRFPVAPKTDLADGFGFIQAKSTPPAAAISLDSLTTGNATPFVLLRVPAGKHELWLTKEGYGVWSSTVNVVQGETVTLDAVLSKSFGTLEVSSDPSGAAISLDDSGTGETTSHLFAKVSTGRHSLGLTKYRYPDWDTAVIVTPGETTNIRAILMSPPDSLWITASSGGSEWACSQGPERAVRLDARPGIGYPLLIAKVSAVFCPDRDLPWPDSSFRFKIYGSDGRTLLYESPVLEAVPGEQYPIVVHELRAPVLVDSGEFYVSVAPIGSSGLPSSLATSRYNRWNTPRGVPLDTSSKRSYSGSPGRWSLLTREGELSLAVQVWRFGSIQVNSTPAAAAITLDAASTGEVTPFFMSNVVTGKHDLRLTMDGYADWHSSVTVTHDQTTTADAALSQSFGSLQVGSTPSGVAIFLDGTNTGRRTPHSFTNMAVRTYRLELRGAYRLAPRGDQPKWDSRVSVRKGQTTTIGATLQAPPESLWVTYASANHVDWGISWGVRMGPERAMKFNPRDFGFDYPVNIRKVRASFHLWGTDPWPDSGFRFRIYGSDGQTMLYQSPVLLAVPGNAKGPAVVHELSIPILVDSGDFYVAVSPVDTSGLPSSVVVWGYIERSHSPIPRPPANPNGRSYTGSPGHWSRLDVGEFLLSVQLRR